MHAVRNGGAAAAAADSAPNGWADKGLLVRAALISGTIAIAIRHHNGFVVIRALQLQMLHGWLLRKRVSVASDGSRRSRQQEWTRFWW